MKGRDADGRFNSENGGRPKGAVNKTTRQIREFLAPFEDDILLGLLQLAVGREVWDKKEGRLVKLGPATDENVRQRALADLADRLWGRPKQSIEVSQHHESLADLLDAEDRALLEQAPKH